MKFFLLSITTALFVVLSIIQPAHADWLGLAPGDYTVTLQNSSALCGGTNCVGTVHIGSPGPNGFDWLFSFTSPPATYDCGPSCQSLTDPNDGRELTMEDNFASDTQFALIFNPTSLSKTFGFFNASSGATIATGEWGAVPTVPEPSSLLLIGLGALGLRARMRRRES